MKIVHFKAKGLNIIFLFVLMMLAFELFLMKLSLFQENTGLQDTRNEACITTASMAMDGSTDAVQLAAFVCGI
jgi:hypothetical protein